MGTARISQKTKEITRGEEIREDMDKLEELVKNSKGNLQKAYQKLRLKLIWALNEQE